MILRGVVYLVDWRSSEVKRTLEIKDLYSPMHRIGIGHEKIYTLYWHDRRAGKVKFSVGTFVRRDPSKSKRTDCYLTSLEGRGFILESLYGGWFEDSMLFEETNRNKDQADLVKVKKNTVEESLSPPRVSRMRDMDMDEIKMEEL